MAVPPELIRSPWLTGDEAWKTMDQFIDGARSFAIKSSAKFLFIPAPAPLPPEQPESSGTVPPTTGE